MRRCEGAGLNGVGVHDHHHSGRHVYVALTYAASRTDKIRLYPATSNTVTRHPLVLAALANSLEEIAPGRTFLSLAPGYLSVESVGRKATPIEKLREDVLTIRRLLAGEEVLTHREDHAAQQPARATATGAVAGVRASVARACGGGSRWCPDAGGATPERYSRRP